MPRTPFSEYFVSCHYVRRLRIAFAMSELDLPKNAIGYLLIRVAQHLFLNKVNTHGL